MSEKEGGAIRFRPSMFRFSTYKPHISVGGALINVQQFRISGITKTRIVKKLKPSDGRSP